jgi:hypothetical protein
MFVRCSRSLRRCSHHCPGTAPSSNPHTFSKPRAKFLRNFAPRLPRTVYQYTPRISGFSVGGTTFLVLGFLTCASFVLVLRSVVSGEELTTSGVATIEQSGQRKFRGTTSLIGSPISRSAAESMPVETLPGRPGTLTPEQEAKLHQFWQVTLKVFGVHGQNGGYEPNSTNGMEVDEDNGATPSALQQKQEIDAQGLEKKKRRSFFSRIRPQKESEPQATSTSTDATSSVSTFLSPTIEENDKYGQTKEFQQALASQTPEDLRAAFWSMVKHDHPDGLLLRFLRARKWDVERALVMLVSTMHWRGQEAHVDDDVIKVGEGGALEAAKSSDTEVKREAEDFLAQLRIGKSYLHGLDKHDRPICVVKVRLHRQGEQSEKSLERYTVYLIETARLLLAPPVDTAVSCA